MAGVRRTLLAVGAAALAVASLLPARPAGAGHEGAGYHLVAADGGVFAFGAARFAGSTGAIRLNQPIVAVAATPTGAGYWLVARDGGIFAFGDAPFVGSASGLSRSPVVGMAPTPTGRGYWLAAADGTVFRFGDAPFHGSAAGRGLSPVVGIAAAGPAGYWLATAAGDVVAFGSAQASGSLAGRRLAQPIVAVAADPGGEGYWLVARDGGVFAFGGAPFLGSTGAIRLNQPIVGLAAPPAERGETIAPGTYLERSDGGAFVVLEGGRVVSAGSAFVQPPEPERLRFSVDWSHTDGRVSARLENTSGVRMVFPDGLRVLVRLTRNGAPWRDVVVADPAIRALEPRGTASVFRSGAAVPDGDGQYGWSGETTVVLV